MEINKLIRKRLLVFTSTLLIIAILTITSSYALANNDITKTDIQENTNKLTFKFIVDLKQGFISLSIHKMQFLFEFFIITLLK